ncbi:LysR substrate-binding domain-containing protein [Apilactobacillus apisilvae]|uniref:LysR substrate-binding domain-containing protein n=1 Tax=Apilactobacillus apisilvae TaxID=2923364 RepID=A0ABY4PG75_9LACO|nr:LysR substrate-binding domain-containing protein [Apilactobacillus apisilvae]UQS84821.1 LysR substrate-binding domain-containing protein [Apilactobacillus apisilvae]
MNTRDLEYFISLTELKVFSKVAEEFNVSQPTITFALKRLEQEMDSNLIIRHRTHGDLIVTDSGKQLLKHARAIIRHFEVAKQNIANLKSNKIAIGLPPIIETKYFPKIAQNLKAENLLNNITTFEYGSETTLDSLKNGELDLALLGSINPLEDARIETEEIDQIPFYVYVSKNHHLANQESVNFSDLRHEDFILFKQGFVQNESFRQLTKKNGMHPNIILRSNETNNIMNLISNNVGIGFFNSFVSYPKNVVRLKVDDENMPKFVTSLVYLKSHYFNELQQKVLNNIRHSLK